MASNYKTLPSQYHAAASEVHWVLLSTSRSARPDHIWNVQACRLMYLLTFINISALTDKGTDLVLLLGNITEAEWKEIRSPWADGRAGKSLLTILKGWERKRSGILSIVVYIVSESHNQKLSRLQSVQPIHHSIILHFFLIHRVLLARRLTSTFPCQFTNTSPVLFSFAYSFYLFLFFLLRISSDGDIRDSSSSLRLSILQLGFFFSRYPGWCWEQSTGTVCGTRVCKSCRVLSYTWKFILWSNRSPR